MTCGCFLTNIVLVCCFGTARTGADISSVPADLTPPPMTEGTPAPGRRVKQVASGYQGTAVYHALYLPINWQPGRRYPVLVEYAGNGPYRSPYGDVSSGQVEDSNLGYGISGGEGCIWICMPYVSTKKANQTKWWGDVEATLSYCRKVVRHVCEDYGGDPSVVILVGYSRGAIGCGYLGLHDDEMADIWLAFVAYAHFDGVSEKWGYPGADRQSSQKRLKRLHGRAVFICSEDDSDGEYSLLATHQYLATSGVSAPFTFQWTAFRNHNDAWTLRPSPARDALRKWLVQVLEARPGTHAVCGRVTDSNGRPVAGVRIESGSTHFAHTDTQGRYALRGLIDGRRALKAVVGGAHFQPTERFVVLAGEDVGGVDFVKTK